MVLLMDDHEVWGQAVRDRILAIGIADTDFAARADMDRGTLKRATEGDPKTTDRTRIKIEKALSALEDEIGMAESGRLVTGTVDYKGRRITLQGNPDDVAATVRKMFGE